MAVPGGVRVGIGIRLLLEAAEYLERRERDTAAPSPPLGHHPARAPPALDGCVSSEAEHGFASLLPGGKEPEVGQRGAKVRRSGGGGGREQPGPLRSTHSEMEKNRRAHLRLCLEKLKRQVPLWPKDSRHTTLSLLRKAKLYIKKLEDGDRKAMHQIKQLQQEQRHLKRKLAKLGMERIRMDSIGSTVSSERSDWDREEMDVDVESTDELPADLDWSSSSPSDLDERGSLLSVCSDEGYSSSSIKRLKLQSDCKPSLGL